MPWNPASTNTSTRRCAICKPNCCAVWLPILGAVTLRLRKVEADQSNLDAALSGRVEILERRLGEIEQRLGAKQAGSLQRPHARSLEAEVVPLRDCWI